MQHFQYLKYVFPVLMILFGLAISLSPVLAYYLAGREYLKKYSKCKEHAKPTLSKEDADNIRKALAKQRARWNETFGKSGKDNE